MLETLGAVVLFADVGKRIDTRMAMVNLGALAHNILVSRNATGMYSWGTGKTRS